MERVQRALSTPPLAVEIPEGSREAAVALLFYNLQRPSLLMIKRAIHPGDPWSGQMAFPGGHMDPGDLTTRHTAERETLEEVGVDLSSARLFGRLETLPVPRRIGRRGPLVIHPCVYGLQRPPNLRPNSEVAHTVSLPLDDLLGGVGRGEFRYRHGELDLNLPRVDLEGERIWGLSLRILDGLLERIRAL